LDEQAHAQVRVLVMERVVLRSALVARIEPHSPRAKTGRPPFPIETMLRIHFMQNWFTFGDQAMEEARIDTPLYRVFAQLNVGADRLPDAITILRFRRLLERHGLAQQVFVAVNELLAAKGLVVKSGPAADATIINAPSSTKNSSGQRDPDTLEWVSWFNHQRLLEPIGYIPPAEAEANYYRQLANQVTAPA
jgi:IS5 family transposase